MRLTLLLGSDGVPLQCCISLSLYHTGIGKGGPAIKFIHTYIQLEVYLTSAGITVGIAYGKVTLEQQGVHYSSSRSCNCFTDSRCH